MNIARLARIVRTVLPYFMLEIFMPGGTIVALILWMAQRQQARLIDMRDATSSMARQAIKSYSVPQSPSVLFLRSLTYMPRLRGFVRSWSLRFSTTNGHQRAISVTQH